MVKNLVDKLSIDEYNHEYLIKNYQEGGRFKLFSSVFFGKMGAMSKANWMMLLFCLPVFAVIFYASYLALNIDAAVPFSANFGLGYPVVSNVSEIYNHLVFKNNMFRALLLVPGIIVGFIGLAGAFNIIKYECLGFNVKIIKTFFKGIKNNFITFMWLGLVNSLVFFQLVAALNFYGNPDLALAWKIVTITLSVLLMAFSAVVSMYVMTQAALYDLPLVKMLKNAFWFTVSFGLQNIIILIFSLVPVGLLVLMNTSYLLQLIVIMVCAMLGFSYIICIWTVYSHYVYSAAFSAAIEARSGKGKKKKRGQAAKA